jgi:hypothetical protein
VGLTTGVPSSYKAWVFGTKLAGVLIFAVGIEMLTRGSPAWAALLLVSGAAIVVAPVGSPDEWSGRFRRSG